jgi:uncharacterized membrane protein (DUF485 family)
LSWHYTFHYIIYYIYSEEAESEIAKQDVDRVDHIADDLGKEKESVSFYILILSTICLSFICTIILCSIHVKRVIGEFEPLSWRGVLNTTLCEYLSCLFSPDKSSSHEITKRNDIGLGLWCLMPLSKYFSYIMVVSFIAGGNQSTWRKPPTCC